MRKLIPAALAAVLAGAALAQDPTSVVADGTKNADQTQDEAESAPVADAKDPEEFVVPPGFKTKKRGDVTLYCIRGKATGTRFQTESCYDEAQLRDYLLAREQNNRDFDQARSVCSNPATCGSL
ncbi:MAG: hypothetical protein AB7T20_08325 [Steroidobacteraceae bacterium]